ncbi:MULTISPECIES: MarR family winged helix-turn-helix transcriptional regulator [Actinoplanes]|uniref:MarR family winged helix-turn-helix transcriptional regulator n=1 Tax=Actinoplanes TaxID=1865 RepID=UPI0005F28764|nr:MULTISPECIES: MarR family winged helix-turn-helix transcriptional regulator [Actinoplanes]GLY07536.1 MarR family transcriptional regulator [Actinoplanes sp. NBRC 101535]
MTEIPASAARAAGETRVVFSRIWRRLREATGIGSFTPSQMAVLSRLDRGGPATMSSLAAAERVRPQSMSATLAVIEQHGLIKREPDPADGRRQIVSLTGTGEQAILGWRRQREEWLVSALTEHYTEAERQKILEAMALLDRLSDL